MTGSILICSIFHQCNYKYLHCSCLTDSLYSIKLTNIFLSPQTSTHICLITDFCPGGELFALLDKQPMKMFKEESARYSYACVQTSSSCQSCTSLLYHQKYFYVLKQSRSLPVFLAIKVNLEYRLGDKGKCNSFPFSILLKYLTCLEHVKPVLLAMVYTKIFND